MYSAAAIVLAAGLSRRMRGRNKLLLRVGNDILLRRVIRICAAVTTHPVTVVTGYQAPQIHAELRGFGVNCVHNEDFEAGQMTSVDSGLRGAPRADAYILALGDQPRLTVAGMSQMLAAHIRHADGRITVPMVDGMRGNPVIIPAVLRAQMLADPVNLGCRNLTRNSPETVHQFDTTDPGFIDDIDTPDDYDRARAQMYELENY